MLKSEEGRDHVDVSVKVRFFENGPKVANGETKPGAGPSVGLEVREVEKVGVLIIIIGLKYWSPVVESSDNFRAH